MLTPRPGAARRPPSREPRATRKIRAAVGRFLRALIVSMTGRGAVAVLVGGAIAQFVAGTILWEEPLIFVVLPFVVTLTYFFVVFSSLGRAVVRTAGLQVLSDAMRKLRATLDSCPPDGPTGAQQHLVTLSICRAVSAARSIRPSFRTSDPIVNLVVAEHCNRFANDLRRMMFKIIMPSSFNKALPREMSAEASFYIGCLENGLLGDLNHGAYLRFARDQMAARGRTGTQETAIAAELEREHPAADLFRDIPKEAVSFQQVATALKASRDLWAFAVSLIPASLVAWLSNLPLRLVSRR